MTINDLDIRDTSVLDKISNNITRYLNNVLPGLLGRINWQSLRVYNAKFIELLVRDASKAYDLLLDMYGGDEENAKHIIYMVLKGLFLNYREYVDRAYHAITRRDSRRFHELFDDFLHRLKD